MQQKQQQQQQQQQKQQQEQQPELQLQEQQQELSPPTPPSCNARVLVWQAQQVVCSKEVELLACLCGEDAGARQQEETVVQQLELEVPLSLLRPGFVHVTVRRYCREEHAFDSVLFSSNASPLGSGDADSRLEVNMPPFSLLMCGFFLTAYLKFPFSSRVMHEDIVRKYCSLILGLRVLMGMLVTSA
eukprot:1138206-Pelagomonas_calceolata.AAC.2